MVSHRLMYLCCMCLTLVCLLVGSVDAFEAIKQVDGDPLLQWRAQKRHRLSRAQKGKHPFAEKGPSGLAARTWALPRAWPQQSDQPTL
jgi:hypothetical protein